MGDTCCGGSGQSVKTISKEELQQKMKQGKVQVVNVLEPKWSHLGSIQGSLRIPVSQLEKRAGELDKSREVVTYCAGVQCSASRDGAQKLAALGFDVRAYEGGVKEWQEAGLPVEGAAAAGSSCCGA
jgi:rhodanese-related sulfurtransferase